jgi:predicted DNA-binding transcriptional regulator AlpA
MDRGRETDRQPAGAAAGRLPARAGRASVLPVSLPPRGLKRSEAAAYVGLGATTFDRAVADGLMPKPFRLYGRVLWCRLALDAAIDVLRDAQSEAEAARASDTWASYQ